MYACPTCRKRTIGYFRKWLSYPAIPARCSECHCYSSAYRTSRGLGIVVFAVVITLCGFASIGTHSGWPLLAGAAGSAAFYAWHWHRVALEPLTSLEVSGARSAEGLFALAAILSVFLK